MKKEDYVMSQRMRTIILRDILSRFYCIDDKTSKCKMEMRDIADELIMMNVKEYLPDIMDKVSRGSRT